MSDRACRAPAAAMRIGGQWVRARTRDAPPDPSRSRRGGWYNQSVEPPRFPAVPPLAAWLAGVIDHEAYIGLAERLAWEVSEPGGRGPTLLLCELKPLITIGRLGSRTDVRFTDDELRAWRLGVRFTGRGGGAILHGPGQVFASLVTPLDALGLGRHGVGPYIGRLEAGVAEALRTLGCEPRSVPGGGLCGRSGLLAAVTVAGSCVLRSRSMCEGAGAASIPASSASIPAHAGPSSAVQAEGGPAPRASTVSASRPRAPTPRRRAAPTASAGHRWSRARSSR